MKDLIKSILNLLHLDITKNLKYDRLTKLVIKRALNLNSNAIDIGCHKGEILVEILKNAPNGQHFAFEPIPLFYQNLQKNSKKKQPFILMP